MKHLLDHRFLLIAGKGGVGRTTVAAALARTAVRMGKRVLLAQMHAPERLGRLLGHGAEIGPVVMAIEDGLSAVNMDPKAALHEYGVLILKYKPLYRALFENKPMRSFLGAFPGLDYWTMLGKAWWHTTEQFQGKSRYDLVILDGPASGHAITMLRIPDAIERAMPMGPLARDAALARALVTDPVQSSVVLVTLPEELPARETVALARDLRALRIPLGPLVINAMPPAHAADPAFVQILQASRSAPSPQPLAGVLAGAAVLAARRRDAERICYGLANDPGLPILQLPKLATNDLGPEGIAQLVELLTKSLLPSTAD